MPNFNHDEVQLISFYTGTTLSETLENLKAMSEFIGEDEPELSQMTASVLFKLSQMDEKQYQELTEKVIPDTLPELPLLPGTEA